MHRLVVSIARTLDLTRDRPRQRWADEGERRLLLAGVFCTFMPMGLMGAMILENPGNWTAVGLIAGFSGVSAVCWAASFIYNVRWLTLIIAPLQFLIPFVGFPRLAAGGWLDRSPGTSVASMKIIMLVAAILSIVLGYIIAMRVARHHERRSNQAKAELDLASEIHRTLVPNLSLESGSIRIVGNSVASNTMGGDLIDAVEGPNGVDALLVDVAGHGVGAGIVMGMVKSTSRALLRESPPLPKLLSDLNIMLTELTRPGMFATMSCARLKGAPSGATVEFALAGHLPIFIRRGDGTIEECTNDSLPLGVDPNESFRHGTTQLRPGDVLVMLTDGLVEVQDVHGRELGLATIRRVIAGAGKSAAEVRTALFSAARTHGAAIDDQSVLAIDLEGCTLGALAEPTTTHALG